MCNKRILVLLKLIQGTFLTSDWNRQVNTPAPYPDWGSKLLLRYLRKEEFIPLPPGNAELLAAKSGLPGQGLGVRIQFKGQKLHYF